jgi:alkylhydroperoxidase/carboxymuconolactone decarboxylase family protein YurZ
VADPSLRHKTGSSIVPDFIAAENNISPSHAKEHYEHEHHAQSFFTPVTIATTPETSKPLLENTRRFIPNMMATFANSPIVLQGYLALEDVFERGSFTPKERQIILLATSVENDCSYCPQHIPLSLRAFFIRRLR